MQAEDSGKAVLGGRHLYLLCDWSVFGKKEKIYAKVAYIAIPFWVCLLIC